MIARRQHADLTEAAAAITTTYAPLVCPAARREILRQVLRVELVAGSADARDYVREWGPPASSQRLTKVRNSIAAFSRNAQRRNADYSEAIADWEEDLDWLAATYG